MAVTAENRDWKMKKMVKILIPLPIIQNINMVIKICIFELVAIYISFYLKSKITFSIISFFLGS